MGLDNGFVLRSTSSKDIDIEMFTFRNYYELNRWIKEQSRRFEEYEIPIDEAMLSKLENEIEYIAQELSRFSDSQLDYYEKNGWPEELESNFFGRTFDPIHSGSSFASNKLIRLYRSVLSMRDILDNNETKELYFIFYSSY